ncbi:MAG: phytanoyl-CoA dioxygenase family protein [Planctomycetota bacterium]
MSSFIASDEQIARFHKDGFLLVRNLLDDSETQGLRRYARGDDDPMGESIVRSDSSGVETRLTLKNELDDACVYTAIVRSQRVAGTMQRLLGDEVYHYHHKMTLKEPKIGGAWEWHQDYGYWYNNGCLYPNMGSCMIAVDNANQANGCLQVLRGSHLVGRVDHMAVGDQTGADPDRVQAVLERHERVYCEMKPGDAVFFHGNLFHCSDQNTSDQPRWSLICCYNTKRNDPFEKKGPHPSYSPLTICPDHQLGEMIRQRYSLPSGNGMQES